MAARDSEHVTEFKKSLESWTDHRFASSEDLFDLAMFHMYLVNLAEDDGWSYAGHSLKLGTPMSVLVVKSWHDETPMVVFTNARTPTGCIRVFMRKLAGGMLEWREDKYRR